MKGPTLSQLPDPKGSAGLPTHLCIPGQKLTTNSKDAFVQSCTCLFNKQRYGYYPYVDTSNKLRCGSSELLSDFRMHEHMQHTPHF